MVLNLFIQFLLTIVSMAMQRRRQKKMQKRADEAAEAQKGFDIPMDGEPIHLPLVYGYGKIAGVRATVHVADNGEIVPIPTGFQDLEINLPVGTYLGEKKEFLTIQQAFCFGDIEEFLDFEVDGQNWDWEQFSHHIRYSTVGGVADPTANKFGVPNAETNKFENIAWANMTFRLNRDDPEYAGAPDVVAYVKGTRIRDIVLNNGTWEFSNNYIFSNNSALVLADYLTRDPAKGGAGISDDRIDIASFGKAKGICDRVVDTAAKVRGRVNGIRPVQDGDELPEATTRTVRLYECNINIDTARTRRDIIETLLETMAQSDLSYAGGKYKLILDYPQTAQEQEDLIAAEYSDDDIIGKIEFAVAGAGNKFNRCEVKFRDESLDFATNSVSWPKRDSNVHLAFLADDNNVPNETSYTMTGATQRKIALAKAEEIVRASRSAKTLTINLPNYSIVHEIGDIIRINSVAAGITNELFKIVSMQMSNEDLQMRFELEAFDRNTLAWNVDDDEVEDAVVIPTAVVPNVTNLQWTDGARKVGKTSNGWLSWTAPTTTDVRRFHIWAKQPANTEWEKIGQTIRKFFDIPADFNVAGDDYQFLVKTENAAGHISQGAMVLADQMPNLVPVSDVSKNVGINTVKLKWDNANPSLVAEYRVYMGGTSTRSSAVLFGTTTNKEMVISPLVTSTYYFWIDTHGEDGSVAAMNSPITVTAFELGIKGGDISANTISWSQLAITVRNDMDDALAAANSAAQLANNYAQVANTHAEAAKASELAANTFQTAANTFKNSAEIFKNAANVSANSASVAATNAANSASASANSASSAAAYANSSGTYAAAAANSAITANTLAGQAGVYANSAATSAANSSSFATAAATSAGVAANSASDSLSASKKQMPDDFTNGDMFWSNSMHKHNDDSGIGGRTFIKTTNEGEKVCELVADTGYTFLANAGYVVPVAGRKYRVTSVSRQVAGVLNRSETTLGLRIHTSTGGYKTSSGTTPTYPSMGEWITETAIWTAPDPITTTSDYAGIRASFLTRPNGNSADVFQLRSLKFEDVTESFKAEGGAEAAANSASSAAAWANTSGQYANSASVSKVAASTYANNAANSASAASISAATANSHANTAGQWASAANNSATTANTYAGNALVYRNQSANSASEAANSASQASTQAGIAVSARDTALTVSKKLLPDDFANGDDFWSLNLYKHNDDGGISSSRTYFKTTTDTNEDVCEIVSGTYNTYARLAHAGYVVPVAGRKYRATVVARQVAGSLNRSSSAFGIRVHSSTGGYTTGITGTITYPSMYEWTTETVTWTAPEPMSPTSDYAGLRSVFYANANGNSADIFQVLILKLEDVTESVAAANSASAASTSAGNAEAFANSAGQWASAANNSATSANTYAGNALVYRNQSANSASEAANSATNAANSASYASEQAGVAVTAKDASLIAGKKLLPSDFTAGDLFWSNSLDKNNDGNGLENTATVIKTNGAGDEVCEVTAGTGYNTLAQAGYIVPVAGRQYRATLVVRQISGTLNRNSCGFGVRVHKSGGGYKEMGFSSVSFPAMQEWTTLTVGWNAPAPLSPATNYGGIRASFFTQPNGNSNDVFEVRSLSLEDITESSAAANSASAASTSAGHALAHANTSGQYANAANTSAVSANTSRSQALTYRNAAANSASEAADSASAASVIEGTITQLVSSENFSNPVLKKFDTVWPSGYTGMSTETNRTISTSQTGGKYYGYLQFDTSTTSGSVNKPKIEIRSDATDSIINMPDSSKIKDISGLRVNAELERRSGQFGGSCIRVQWEALGTGGSSQSVFYFFKDNLIEGGAYRKIQTIEFDAIQPDGFVAGSDGARLVVAIHGSSNFGGHTQQTCVLRLHKLGVKALTKGASTVIQQSSITDLKGNMEAAIALRATSNNANAELELIALNDAETGDTVSQARIAADQILLDGSVRVPQLKIKEQLKISARNGSISFGKNGAGDASDGIWVGNNTAQDGSKGFGMYASRNIGSEQQSIRLTKDDGLLIKNAQFAIGSGIASKLGFENSTSYTLPNGTKVLNISLSGAGGGGGGGQAGHYSTAGSDGSNGGNTVIYLRDGSTTVATYTANGGDGGEGGAGPYNENTAAETESEANSFSPFGDGGEGGDGLTQRDFRSHHGRTGEAGQVRTWENIDVSGLSSPNIVVSIGNGGAGGSAGGGGADAGLTGAKGYAEISTSGDTALPAGPVSYEPSKTGTWSYSNLNNYVNLPSKSGARGAYYLLTNVPASYQINLGTHIINSPKDGTIGFFTKDRPKFKCGTSVTLNYYIYPLG
ncbi:hypothetical protein [Neptunicoccus sediminis]|uniref:hypothetical protein n=1 Tax=Neptunicoccus sediminis TaxID=1892596 RepID=UPI000AEEEBF5|nr:hypothetical protein [Neptunicoccus sediminis]